MSETNLMEVVKQTAFNVAGISEQMGILTTEVRSLKKDMLAFKEETEKRFDATNMRMQSYEDRIRLTRPQANNIRQSIHARVRELLDIRYEDGIVADECLSDDVRYRPGFISRCYTDARRESKLGTPYSETYQRDYEEVLDYIAKWVPPTGVDGYKAYLDARRMR